MVCNSRFPRPPIMGEANIHRICGESVPCIGFSSMMFTGRTSFMRGLCYLFLLPFFAALQTTPLRLHSRLKSLRATRPLILISGLMLLNLQFLLVFPSASGTLAKIPQPQLQVAGHYLKVTTKPLSVTVFPQNSSQLEF